MLSPADRSIGLLTRYVFSLARYDRDYDVRARGRTLGALLAGDAQPAGKPAGGKAKKATTSAERPAPKTAPSGVEAAKKALQSKAMGARKAVKAGA